VRRLTWSSRSVPARRPLARAEELGLTDAALLEETLEEEEATDAALTKIAESVVNQEAVAAE
jgi:ferritin-like metal-binding protein YciE